MASMGTVEPLHRRQADPDVSYCRLRAWRATLYAVFPRRHPVADDGLSRGPPTRRGRE